MKKVYLDNGATTMMDSKVIEAIRPYFDEKYGNPSSTHSLGGESKNALEESRKIIAKSINAKPEEIIFTSGGTESNNFALKGISFANKDKGNHIIITKVEHKCVINSCKWLEKQGFEVTYLSVDKEGFVYPKELEKAITEKTILVSIIHGNNEIGTIQDLKKLGDVCRRYNVYFHTDACQSYTKTELDMEKQPVDLMTLNAHKIHGPKGVGVLYIRKGTKIMPWQGGGGQEFNMRSGTEDIPGVVGFAEAVNLGLNKKHVDYMTKLRDKLIKGMLKISHSRLNGATGDKRLCNNVNISFDGVEGEAIGGYLDDEGVCSSTGSACSEATLEPSYVLRSIGLSHQEANGSLRLTLSRFTTEKEIDYVLEILPGIIEKLRKMSPIGNIRKEG
ncbi:cysteine desulfurase NifS [Candidatus Woesearchaeota archaeon B3_Woes]|nr:MAG: cysteine desulfurase NifS [Candidatus Woesearchaeota archaeon B3_Woes]